jgi:sugar phosphate isomerase/epimerase
MLLSAQTKVISRKLDYEKAIEIIARAGFDAFDLTLGRIHVAAESDSPYGNTADRIFLTDQYMDYAEHLRKVAEREHIVCNQAHAPFPLHRYGKTEYNDRLFELTVRSMQIASHLGAKTIVFHPAKDCPEDVDAFAYNVAFFNRFRISSRGAASRGRTASRS